jgi:hypothetical protein
MESYCTEVQYLNFYSGNSVSADCHACTSAELKIKSWH